MTFNRINVDETVKKVKDLVAREGANISPALKAGKRRQIESLADNQIIMERLCERSMIQTRSKRFWSIEVVCRMASITKAVMNPDRLSTLISPLL